MSDQPPSSKELRESIDIGLKELQQTYKVPETDLVIEKRAQITANLAIFYWKLNELPEARKYFSMALVLYEKLGDEFHAANVNSSLGTLFIQMGEYQFGLKYSENAFEYWKTHNYLNERIACMQNIGICLLKMNEDVRAADIILSAIQMAVHLKDENQFAMTIQILLEHYEKQERYDMLLELKKKALDFWLKLEIPERILKTLIDLGVICQVLQDYNTAIIYFKRAYNHAFNAGDIEKMFLAEGFIGECYVKLGEIEKAKHTYLQTFKLAVYLNSFSDRADDVESMRLMLLTFGFSMEELKAEEEKAQQEAQKDLSQ